MTTPLTLADLQSLTVDLGVPQVRDMGLLDAAAARPQASAFGEDAYPTVGLKAAALLQSVIRNHPLVDGNKRLGWLAAVVLLDLHGVRPNLTQDEAFDLVIDAIEQKLDVDVIERRLRIQPRV